MRKGNFYGCRKGFKTVPIAQALFSLKPAKTIIPSAHTLFTHAPSLLLSLLTFSQLRVSPLKLSSLTLCTLTLTTLLSFKLSCYAISASRLVKSPDSHASDPCSRLGGSSWLCYGIISFQSSMKCENFFSRHFA